MDQYECEYLDIIVIVKIFVYLCKGDELNNMKSLM